MWNSDQQILHASNNPFWFSKNSKKWSKNLLWTFDSSCLLWANQAILRTFSNTQNLHLFEVWSFNKNPEPGLFECENFQKLRPRGYNKIQEPPNTWFRGQTRCDLSLLNIETKFACCWLVSLSTQGFILSGPFAWALALVKPNTSGFTQGPLRFPLHILHHAGSFIASN